MEMDDNDMEALLGYYKPGTVPKFSDIHPSEEDELYTFDGSFGWW